jgi:uncharacterized protein YheU (UPF0270 family)
MEIPYDQLQPDTLRAVIEEFVTREGTDYGDQTFSLDQKVAHVMNQLRTKKAVVVWDATTESVDIVVKER